MHGSRARARTAARRTGEPTRLSPPPAARGARRRSPATPSRRRRASWARRSIGSFDYRLSTIDARLLTITPPPVHPQPQLRMAAHVHLENVGAPLRELAHRILS